MNAGMRRFLLLFCCFLSPDQVRPVVPQLENTRLEDTSSTGCGSAADALTAHPTIPGLVLFNGETIRLPHAFTISALVSLSLEMTHSILERERVGARACRLLPSGKKDRYGRRIADIQINGTSLVRRLVADGALLVDPASGFPLLKEQTSARRAGLGVWTAVAAYPARQPERIPVDFAIVQGRIMSVGVRRKRIYLNFGRQWRRDFTAAADRPVADSWSFAAPTGRRTLAALDRACVELIGFVTLSDGPFMMVEQPDQITVLPEKACSAPFAGQQ